MNIAIIGSGLIAGIHVKALQSIGEKVVLIVNPHQESAENFAKQFHIEHISTDLEAAGAPGIDCVHICTPPALHAEQIRVMLNAGKHVVCEKPLCLSDEEAEQLNRLAEEKGLVHAVCFNARFNDGPQAMKQSIENGELGELRLIHGSYQQEYHILPDVYSWRYRPQLAGPMRAISEIGSHWLDLAMYVSGQTITSVQALSACVCKDRYCEDHVQYREDAEGREKIHVESEDASAILLRYENGAIGTLLLSEISHGRGNHMELQVDGDRSSMWWNSTQPSRLATGCKGHGVHILSNDFNGGYPATFESMFRCIYRDVHEGTPAKEPQYPTFKDGARVVTLCNAIRKSAEHNGMPVEVEE